MQVHSKKGSFRLLSQCTGPCSSVSNLQSLKQGSPPPPIALLGDHNIPIV